MFGTYYLHSYICWCSKYQNMKYIIREVGKLCMFVLIWGLPVLLSHLNENNNFLWFFILSLIVNVGMFQHYEDLEKLDNSITEEDKTDE